MPYSRLALARKALYMTTLCATLHNLLIKTFYQGLYGHGKPAKVALTAIMRKLLTHLIQLAWSPSAVAQRFACGSLNLLQISKPATGR